MKAKKTNTTVPPPPTNHKPVEANKFAWLNKLLIPAFVIYIIAVIAGVITHESWADEAQAWLLVKDLNLSELFNTLPAEGHPPLWYLVLYPFAKTGFPYETVKWIAAIIMIAAVFILFFKTKVQTYLKLSIPFSFYFIYQYSLYGRSYALIAFFLIAIISLYPKRFERPWLFALCIIGLFNTHMLFFSFTFCLLLLYIADAIQFRKYNAQVLFCIILMAIGGLYLLPYLGTSSIAMYFKTIVTDHTTNLKSIISYGLVPANRNFAVGILILTTLIVLLSKRTKPLLLLIGGLAGLLYIMAFRYSYVQPRHYGTFVLIVFGSYCISSFYAEDRFNLPFKDMTRYGFMLLAVTFLFQVQAGVIYYRNDAMFMYSGSKEAADYILDNKLEHKIIVGYLPWASLAVLPYLPDDVQFYDVHCQRYQRHYIYDNCFTTKDDFKEIKVMKATEDQFPGKLQDVILLVNFQINVKIITNLELIFASSDVPMYQNETFFIYRYK